MTSIVPRLALSDFTFANPFYANARVRVLTVNAETWQPTETLATLYASPVGIDTLANPLPLDGDGKWVRSVYVDEPVVCRILDAGVPTHDTSVIGIQSTYRGDWVSGTGYTAGTVVRDGVGGVNTGYLYMAAITHQAGEWAEELAAGTWVLYLSAGDGMAPSGALLAVNNLDDVDDTEVARANLGAAPQDEFTVTQGVASDAYDARIVSASVNGSGHLILIRGDGSSEDAGSVVGPAGPVTVTGTPLGTWDATTNTPTLSDGSGSAGDAYIVSVAGSTSLDGISTWEFGDTAYRGASAWERLVAPSTSGVFTVITLPELTIEDNDDPDPLTISDASQEVAARLTAAGVFQFASVELARALLGTLLTVADDDTRTEAVVISDALGNIAASVNADGSVSIGQVTIETAPDGYAFVISDRLGNIAGYLLEDGTPGGIFAAATVGASANTYTADDYERRSNRALGLSAAVAGRTNTTAARPIWTYNHVLTYSQSFGSGWESWPSLSKTQPFDNLMVGDSVRPVSESGVNWVQVGTAAFNPLIATVMTNSTTGVLVDDATAAALSPGSTALGETPLEGALNFWRKQQLAWRGLAADPARLLVGSSCGVGGRSIEALSKGAGTELFNRLRGAATIAKGLATAATGTYGVTAIIFMQGENNAANLSGTTDKDAYKALLATLQQDIYDDIADTIAGQSPPPAIFSYQTSGAYVRDANLLGPSRAQLEAAQEFDDFYLVAPTYPVTDKGGFHLDPNGERWMAQQFGKVMHLVLDQGHGWLPVHPLRATFRGTQVLIEFHVPHPPLQFQACYVATTPTTYTDGGFTVTDDTGRNVVLVAEVVGDACVLLTLAREMAANPYLWYGDQTYHAGNGNLCDSDPTISLDNYEYDAASGQYAAANIAALVDAPYPLWNWCCLFRMAIEADPSS